MVIEMYNGIKKDIRNASIIVKILWILFIVNFLLISIIGQKALLFLCSPDMKSFSITDSYRFITLLLSHQGIFHLLVNCIALLYVSKTLNKRLNTPKYIIVWFIGTLLAEISLILVEAKVFHHYTRGIGGSPLIYFLLGVIVLTYIKNHKLKTFLKSNNRYVYFIIIYVTLGSVWNFSVFKEHLCSFIVGMIFAYIFKLDAD